MTLLDYCHQTQINNLYQYQKSQEKKNYHKIKLLFNIISQIKTNSFLKNLKTIVIPGDLKSKSDLVHLNDPLNFFNKNFDTRNE